MLDQNPSRRPTIDRVRFVCMERLHNFICRDIVGMSILLLGNSGGGRNSTEIETERGTKHQRVTGHVTATHTSACKYFNEVCKPRNQCRL